MPVIMEIELIAIGKTTTDYVLKGIDNYIKRLKHYTTFKFTELPDVRRGGNITEAQQKEREAALFMAKIQPSDYLALLDERGKSQSSVEFSSFIEKMQLSGRKRVIFLIGGPYGFAQSIYDRADYMLSLSKMTFNHEMVRLFFIEQLYRAHTILRGEPYHHE